MPGPSQQIQDRLGAIAQKLAALERRAGAEDGARRPSGLLEDCRRLVADLERAFTSLRDAERRQAEYSQEAEIAIRRADLLLSLSPIAYVLVLPNGVIADGNAAAARLLNLSLRHLRGKPFDLFLHGNREAFLRNLRQLGEGTEGERWEVTLRPRERCTRPVTVVASREADGRLSLILLPADGAPVGGTAADNERLPPATDPAATH